MLTTRELQDEILRLKKEKNICILVHAYQSHDIWEVADYVGDSYGLSVEAAKTDADTVLMCGVRSMAETVKMLSPEKKVLLANGIAGCPMADQYSGSDLRELKKEYPGYAVVAYINTTADTKTEADVCVTSSSALKIVKNMPEQDILFMPDPNLGAWVTRAAVPPTFGSRSSRRRSRRKSTPKPCCWSTRNAAPKSPLWRTTPAARPAS